MARTINTKKNAVDIYNDRYPIYQSLCKKVEDIIRENLEQKEIQYHSITSRCKSLESFAEKAKNEKYKDPINEIQDMSGIRIITYLESDVKQVAAIVEGLFSLDQENSLDQSQLLGANILGYRSVHYIAKFDTKRASLPENLPFKDLPFEIQIRSILQHAWAEIEHDRNYKFTGRLPTQLERRFYLVAGMLEMADREFVSIAEEIEQYRTFVSKGLNEGDLDIEVNTASLREFFNVKFQDLIDGRLLVDNFENSKTASEVVDELKCFGINTLSQLEKIIPNQYAEKIKREKYFNTYFGLIRDLMIINDAKKYFSKCWAKHWTGAPRNSVEWWESFRLNIPEFQNYLIARKIDIDDVEFNPTNY